MKMKNLSKKIMKNPLRNIIQLMNHSLKIKRQQQMSKSHLHLLPSKLNKLRRPMDYKQAHKRIRNRFENQRRAVLALPQWIWIEKTRNIYKIRILLGRVLEYLKILIKTISLIVKTSYQRINTQMVWIVKTLINIFTEVKNKQKWQEIKTIHYS